MYIDDFIWLPDIVEKLATKHKVTQDEVEEVFFRGPHFRFVESGYRFGEDVYSALGQTDGGRYLIVFFIKKPRHHRKLPFCSTRNMHATLGECAGPSRESRDSEVEPQAQGPREADRPLVEAAA